MSQPPYDPPTEPPHEPPGEPPPNPPPPPLPPPAYGAPLPPPPRKSRAGLIVGLAVAGIAVIAGLLVLGLVVGSDSDSDDDAADEETTSSTEPEEPEGEVLQGDGYSYSLPDEWQDVSEAVTAQDPGGTIDTASAPGESLEETFANLIVESGAANGETDLEAARDQVGRNLANSVGVTPEEIDGPIIDGEETVGLQMTQSNPAGVEVLQNAYVTILDDTFYVIGFSRDASKDEFEDDFADILESWSWE